MAHISNILKDKLFVFSGPSQTSLAEKEILELISLQENLGKIQKSQTISNGEDYDSYQISTPEGQFLVKVSLDGKRILEKENSVLRGLQSLKIAPTPISCGQISYGDKLDFSVTSFEPLESCESFGKSIFLFNGESIARKLREVHNSELSAESLEESIRLKFEKTSFEGEEYASLLEKNSPNFQLLNEELSLSKAEIQNSFKEQFGGSSLCHGFLKPTNILLGARSLKIINWQNSFLANPLIELADLRMAFDVEDSFEYKVFNAYNSENKYSWDEYLQARNFWASLKLVEYVFSYIREIYLFESLRQDKILEIFSSFCRNFKFFEHVSAFKKHKDEIVGLFSQPML